MAIFEYVLTWKDAHNEIQEYASGWRESGISAAEIHEAALKKVRLVNAPVIATAYGTFNPERDVVYYPDGTIDKVWKRGVQL